MLSGCERGSRDILSPQILAQTPKARLVEVVYRRGFHVLQFIRILNLIRVLGIHRLKSINSHKSICKLEASCRFR